MDRVILEKEIRKAFRGVVLGKGMSLGQARVRDRSGEGFPDEDLAKLIPDNEVKDDWTKIDPDQLDNDLCTGYLDAEGFRYYIPALMLSVLDRYIPIDFRVVSTFSELDADSDHRKLQYAMLNDAQSRAIAHFLQAAPHLLPLKLGDSERASLALQNYWGRYL
jgi:hypothetical protein